MWAAMAMPSITLCGSPSSTLRSMKAPGSPSSALQTANFDRRPADSRGQLPLPPGGKSGAAAAAKARNPHRLDDLVGKIARDDLGQGLVAVAGDVVFDPLRVDHAAVAEHDLGLPLEEIHLGRVGHFAAVGPAVRQPRNDLPAEDVLVDQRAAVLRLDVLVEDVVDHERRAGGTRAQAAGADDRHAVAGRRCAGVRPRSTA